MVKLGPFLLACSFIACIIAWRFFSDSSRRLDKKIGFFVFFLYISNVAYIIFYMLANVLSLFLHVTLLLLLCKRKEKLLGLSRENRDKKEREKRRRRTYRFHAGDALPPPSFSEPISSPRPREWSCASLASPEKERIKLEYRNRWNNLKNVKRKDTTNLQSLQFLLLLCPLLPPFCNVFLELFV